MAEEIIVTEPRAIVVPPPQASTLVLPKRALNLVSGASTLVYAVSMAVLIWSGGSWPRYVMVVSLIILVVSMALRRPEPPDGNETPADHIGVGQSDIALVWRGKTTTIPLHTAFQRHLTIISDGEPIDVPHARGLSPQDLHTFAEELRATIEAAKRNELPA